MYFMTHIINATEMARMEAFLRTYVPDALAGFRRDPTHLYLWGNKIGADGARDLAAALAGNATLTHLDLMINSIGDEGASALAAALAGNKTITTLNLGNNYIGDDGARALAAVLAGNKTLTNLDLVGNNIDYAALAPINELIKRNRQIAIKSKSKGDRAVAEQILTRNEEGIGGGGPFPHDVATYIGDFLSPYPTHEEDGFVAKRNGAEEAFFNALDPELKERYAAERSDYYKANPRGLEPFFDVFKRKYPQCFGGE